VRRAGRIVLPVRQPRPVHQGAGPARLAEPPGSVRAREVGPSRTGVPAVQISRLQRRARRVYAGPGAVGVLLFQIHARSIRVAGRRPHQRRPRGLSACPLLFAGSLQRRPLHRQLLDGHEPVGLAAGSTGSSERLRPERLLEPGHGLRVQWFLVLRCRIQDRAARARSLRLIRRCVGAGRLRVSLTGRGVRVRSVAWSLGGHVAARAKRAPFQRIVARGALARTRSSRLRAVVMLVGGRRVVLVRSLPRCGIPARKR